MCTKANGLEYYDACCCAGTFCGGHLVLNPALTTVSLTFPAAQHTYTRACDGFHAPGPCPPSRQQPVQLHFGG